MPRSRRGGKRAGKPGTAYGNRTDLNVNKTLPIQAASGQAYGERKAQMDAQRAIPLQAPSRPGVQPQQAGPAQLPVTPGALDFTRPSERPDEPVTAGLGVGPGPGPEALGMTPPPGEELERLRPMLPVLELMASNPGASMAARNLVRSLRGSIGLRGI